MSSHQTQEYSEQDYRLQRIARVLNEKHSEAGKVADELVLNPLEEDKTEIREDRHAAVKYGQAKLLNYHSSEKYIDQELSYATNQRVESTSHEQDESTSHQQEESSSDVVQMKPNESNKNTIAMIQLLKENVNKIEGTGENSLLTIWDFAGQYAFYTTHQTFLTRRAIYLLVSDASGQVTDFVADDCYFDSKGIMKCQVHDLVEVWLNSIHSCASTPEDDSPPVILVGTHVDQISLKLSQRNGEEAETQNVLSRAVKLNRSTTWAPGVTSANEPPSASTIFKAVKKFVQPRNTGEILEVTTNKRHEICNRYFREIRSYLKDKPTRFHLIDEDFAIDNTVVDRTLEALKRKIIEVISREDVDKINKEGTVQIEKSEELDLFLRFLHETGTIIYFSIDILRENIVLDPTWLIDALKTLINAQPDLPGGSADNAVSQKWSDFKGRGILSLELIDSVWTKKKYPELYAHKDHILLIMEQLNIIAKPRAFSEIGEKIESYFLAPCMLRQESPSYIISHEQDPLMNLKYELCIWWSPSNVISDDERAVPFQMWCADEGHDSDAPIMPEHMNHARLYVALVTVCTNALRAILLVHVPEPHANIYQAIRAKKADLTKKTQIKRGQWQNALLILDQCKVVFPDPFGRYVASVDQFDISLLYILIRHVSTVSASLMDWGNDPIEQPFRDRCIGASVERIRLYRNWMCKHKCSTFIVLAMDIITVFVLV
ncbi:hypothetical protein ACJMK2_002024 [Sinanodonta woodiana]|uniref:C-terminal of Roc (COR) domain-containing protein n=1 Tax=Sinanodonta woodiana TaxID=1069815 RepID=A0ABD3XVU5_SINWO